MFNDTVQRKVYKLATSALFNFELSFSVVFGFVSAVLYILINLASNRSGIF